MRHSHCTITPAVVRTTARAVLAQALPWRRVGRLVRVGHLLDLLLLVATLGSSLAAVVRRFGFGFSHETARQAVYANLPDLARLTEGLADALHAVGERAWRRRRWDVAIDLHYAPFYGRRDTVGIVGGPHKQGTKYFYAYATAVLLHRRRRYTVGLVPVCGSQQPHVVLEQLLDQLAARGLRLRGVALDSGFDSGETIHLLQTRRLAYVLPLRRKGRGRNARNDWFAFPEGKVFTARWTTDRTRRKVQTAAVVGRRPGDGKVLVYAFGGWGSRSARAAAVRAREAQQARRKYRARYGIETSYRQLNECKGRTTATDARYRLLLVGLALLLRQVWVWLTAQVARTRGARPAAWVGELPLQVVRDWIRDAVRKRYKQAQAIQLDTPLLELGCSCKP
jgi:hypothetical protein